MTTSSASATVTVRPSSSGQRCHPGIGDAARHDAVETRQVRIAVQGETVHGDAAGDAHPDGGDLPFRPEVVRRQPHAAATGHPARWPARGRRRPRSAPVRAIGRRPTTSTGAVSLMIGYPTSWPGPCQVIRPPRSTSTTGVPSAGRSSGWVRLAGRVHRRMLQQQHGIRAVVLRPGGGEFTLPFPGAEVVDESGAHETKRNALVTHALTVRPWVRWPVDNSTVRDPSAATVPGHGLRHRFLSGRRAPGWRASGVGGGTVAR